MVRRKDEVWLIETNTEEFELESRSGRWRVLEEGIHWFGGIINCPWLQTALSRSKSLHTPKFK